MPPARGESLEPAAARHGANRLLVLPVGHDRESIPAVDAGAMD
jgi:hypothetical protein